MEQTDDSENHNDLATRPVAPILRGTVESLLVPRSLPVRVTLVAPLARMLQGDWFCQVSSAKASQEIVWDALPEFWLEVALTERQLPSPDAAVFALTEESDVQP